MIKMTTDDLYEQCSWIQQWYASANEMMIVNIATDFLPDTFYTIFFADDPYYYKPGWIATMDNDGNMILTEKGEYTDEYIWELWKKLNSWVDVLEFIDL